MIPQRPATETQQQSWTATAVRHLLRWSLLVTPRPIALTVRRLFAESGAKTAELLEADAPAEVNVERDIRYDTHPDATMDVYFADDHQSQGATLVWIHGGAFVGGAKEELSGYLKRIAHVGFDVVAPRYSLAPEEHHPTQLRQMMTALGHIDRNAATIGVGNRAFFLAGDSAGAMLAAQLALLISNDRYSDLVGIAPTIEAGRLNGVVLCCGPYSLSGFEGASEAGARFLKAVLWAYSGVRNYASDTAFTEAMDVVDHVGPSFPPTFITVGNADPLRPQSVTLAERLGQLSVPVEALFFPDEHTPPLSHEYQFDLSLSDAQEALAAIVSFMRRNAGDSS